MKLRSFILVCCMVIVPGLAMFSHHVPAATWRSLWPASGETTAAGIAQETAAATPPAVVPPPASAAPGAAGAPLPARHQPTPGPEQTDVPRSIAPIDGGQVAARNRLAALGATTIECQPPGAGLGPVIGSCRVPVDAAGQLQRLFQVSAPDAATALEALADEVSAWRRRAAAP